MGMTIENYLNTSVDDCRVSIGVIDDLEFLRLLLARCLRLERKTLSRVVARRIKQIEKGGL